jgi:phosphoglycerate kinase
MLPTDVVVQDHVVREAALNGCIGSIEKMDIILDSGPVTLNQLKDKINNSQFILWNGPLGLFEKGFTEGTEALAKLIANRTQEGNDGVVGVAKSIIGGGDTLSAISKLGIEDKFTFVSGGGGAMLDFLAQGTLVGIQALDASKV